MPSTDILTSHGIVALKSTHKAVKRLKNLSDTPSLHGNKVWTSCFAMMRYFDENPLTANAKTLEIGCGWGVLSCYLAKVQCANVVATDADSSVQPFFDLTTAENGLKIPFEQQKIEAMSTEYLTPFNVLVGTDICFWDEMTTMLFKLIERSLVCGVQRICIADPGREPFWALADQCADSFYGTVHTVRMGTSKSSDKYILTINEE